MPQMEEQTEERVAEAPPGPSGVFGVKLGSEYELWRACATTTERPVLTGVLIEQNRATATNGFILATVPCKVEPELPELDPNSSFPSIVVPGEFLKEVIKLSRKRQLPGDQFAIDLGARTAYTLDEGRKVKLITGHWPAWRQLLPDPDALNDSPRVWHCGLDTALSTELTLALGLAKGSLPMYWTGGQDSTVLVVLRGDPGALGLQMPLVGLDKGVGLAELRSRVRAIKGKKEGKA